jgi:putative sugar O-methyltransferase
LETKNHKISVRQKDLLKSLISEQEKTSEIYKPGKYWWKKSLSAVEEIEKNGLNQFRSSTDINTAAVSYGDAKVIDSRRILDNSIKNKLGLYILNHTPLKKLFDAQVNTTKKLVNRLLELEKNALIFSNPNRTAELIEKYKIENSINFGCDRITEFKGEKIATNYLVTLDYLDHVEKHITLKNSNSFLEIGPGFGTMIHLIEQNYSNIRKFIVIDIVPNVWIVTEYLRNLYGNNVKDYLETKEMKEIKFKEDESLEIFIIPPWEIEKIGSSIDCFWNLSSFVEMPKNVVKNYAEKIEKISTPKSIYNFITYNVFDLKTTFHPNLIPKLFPKINFEMIIHPYLLNKNDKINYYFGNKISK